MSRKGFVWALIWTLCSIFDFGALNAYQQYRYPEVPHMERLSVSVFLSLFGPFSLPTAVCLTDFLEYGWTLDTDPDFIIRGNGITVHIIKDN